MARWSFSVVTPWTATAVADTTNMVNQKFMALCGGSSTQRIRINKVATQGTATASAPSILVLARDSTVHVTPTALTTGEANAALDPSTAALAAPQVALTQATTKPQRSATLKFVPLTLNAYGGRAAEEWADGEGPELLGNTASLGEISLSAFTGSTETTVTSYIIYEPL